MAMAERVAIVTGAGRGLGAAVSRELSKAGVRVAVCDIDLPLATEVATELRTNGCDAAAFDADVSQPPEIERLVHATLERFGRVDILVNNAAICPRTSIDAMTEEGFDQIIGVNLKSVFFLSRAAGNAMRQHSWGRIVNVSSIGGRTGGIFNATVYSASKAGVMAMTKAFARHFAPYNILVNCVAPGGMETRLMENLTPESLQSTLSSIPLGRLADPAEVARVVAFLTSDGASFMTGATVDANGGALMM